MSEKKKSIIKGVIMKLLSFIVLTSLLSVTSCASKKDCKKACDRTQKECCKDKCDKKEAQSCHKEMKTEEVKVEQKKK